MQNSITGNNMNKLAPYGTNGQLLLTANFNVTWHKTSTKIKNLAWYAL